MPFELMIELTIAVLLSKWTNRPKLGRVQRRSVTAKALVVAEEEMEHHNRNEEKKKKRGGGSERYMDIGPTILSDDLLLLLINV